MNIQISFEHLSVREQMGIQVLKSSRNKYTTRSLSPKLSRIPAYKAMDTEHI